MKIPKTINNRKYEFVEQCNDNLFRYRHILAGYSECFAKFQLGLIKEQIPMGHKATLKGINGVRV